MTSEVMRFAKAYRDLGPDLQEDLDYILAGNERRISSSARLELLRMVGYFTGSDNDEIASIVAAVSASYPAAEQIESDRYDEDMYDAAFVAAPKVLAEVAGGNPADYDFTGSFIVTRDEYDEILKALNDGGDVLKEGKTRAGNRYTQRVGVQLLAGMYHTSITLVDIGKYRIAAWGLP